MATGFNLAGLSEYVNEHSQPIIRRSILEGKTISLIDIMPNVKHKSTINRIEGDLVILPGNCGFAPSGSTALDQREMEVCPLKINEQYCAEDLTTKYVNTMLKAGHEDAIPFEAQLVDEKVQLIQDAIETLVWQGDTSSASASINKCDGFFKTLSGDTGVSTIVGYTGITQANAIALVDEMIDNIDVDVINANNLTIFMGFAEVRAYARAFRTLNRYNAQPINEDEGDQFRLVVDGTNVTIQGVKGLNGTGKAMLSPADNLVFGTDLLDESSKYVIKYDEFENQVKAAAYWKMGVQAKWARYVVVYNG